MMRLYNGDCFKVMRQIEDNSVDCIITDPPYKLSLDGGGLFRKRERAAELEFISNFGRDDILSLSGELRRVCKRVNVISFASRSQIRFWYEAFPDIDPVVLVWGKTNAMPLTSNNLKSDLEYALWFREKGVPCRCNYRTGSRYDILPVNKLDKGLYGHPTIKPLEIIKRYLGFSTGVACVSMGRDFIGIEMDKGHFATASARIRQAEIDKESEFDFGGEQ